MTRFRVGTAAERVRKRGAIPATVRSILGPTLKRYGLDRGLEKYEFVLRWKEIVGEEIAKRSRPEKVRGRTLLVRVQDSAWAQELTFQKSVLLSRLKRNLGDSCRIDDIYFLIDG